MTKEYELGSGADLLDYYLNRGVQAKVGANVLSVNIHDLYVIHRDAKRFNMYVTKQYLESFSYILKESK